MFSVEGGSPCGFVLFVTALQRTGKIPQHPLKQQLHPKLLKIATIGRSRYAIDQSKEHYGVGVCIYMIITE